MKFLDGVLSKMNLSSSDEYDEDYDDTELDEMDDDAEGAADVKAETAAEAETAAAAQTSGAASPFRKKATKPVTGGKVVSMQNGNAPAQENEKASVCMIIPKDYKTSNEIAELLLSGKVVVLNMEGMNYDEAQRVIDFTSGACYTMGGNLQKISKKIVIATPSSVALSGDFTELLAADDDSDKTGSTYSLKV